MLLQLVERLPDDVGSGDSGRGEISERVDD
jgi:hypothetical protein